MGKAPDQHLAAMAADILESVRHLGTAFRSLTRDDDLALREADLTISGQRSVERSYQTAMSAAMELNRRARAVRAPRALPTLRADCRQVVLVAERIWYAVVKQA
jgi:hypothetical protein